MTSKDLEALLREARAAAGDPPPFGHVWGRAKAQQVSRRRRRWATRVAVTLPAAALLVALLVVAPGRREPLPEVSAEELARQLSEWRAPLDFLLEPPGGDLLGGEPFPSIPTLEASAFDLQETL